MPSIIEILNMTDDEFKRCKDIRERVLDVVGNDVNRLFVISYTMYMTALQVLYMRNPKRAVAAHMIGMMLWEKHKDDEEWTA